MFPSSTRRDDKTDLKSNDAVDGAAANISQYHNLVSSLLQDQGVSEVNFYLLRSKMYETLLTWMEVKILAMAPSASRKTVIAESCKPRFQGLFFTCNVEPGQCARS